MEVRATRHLLAGEESIGFAVVGRSSGGNGARNVNRTLSPRRLVVLVEWHDAQAATDGRALLDAYWRRRGAVVWSAGLAPLRASGTWRSVAAFAPKGDGTDADDTGLVASLTYAQIRPSRLHSFYLFGFPRTARRMTGKDSPMLAGIGFGDVPVRHACTFSVWPSNADLVRVLHGRSEPHGIVARRSIDEQWLSESLFARFAVVDHSGAWAGSDPLR